MSSNTFEGPSPIDYTLIEGFREAAFDLPPNVLRRRRPKREEVYSTADRLAVLVRLHYASETDKVGFDRAHKVTDETAQGLEDLRGACEAADVLTRQAAREHAEVGVAEGRALIKRFRREFDYAVEDQAAREELEQLVDQYGVAPDRETLPTALRDHARFAHEHPKTMARSVRFDPGWITEALNLADAYAELDTHLAEARDLANRLIAMLAEEIRSIRNTARYLWRYDRPDLWRAFRTPPAPRAQPQPAEEVTEAVEDPQIPLWAPIEDTGSN